ncbi:MAG: hypothetical protein VYD19_02625 [Myxococcota bacterium]|nr:hypothetical protein [Myxococcota bacterium]
MRALNIFLSLLLVLSLAACQSPDREMIGYWRVDMEQIKRDPALSKIGPEARTLTERWSARMLQGWRFRFDADQHTELVFQGSQYRGTFEIVQRIGRSLRVRVRLRQLALNPIDMLLGITKNDQAESIELLFGLRFSGQNGLLKFDEMPEIPLRRVAIGE